MVSNANYSYLDELEAKSIYILREAYNRLNPMGMMWSIGKDSTAMLWMVRDMICVPRRS